MNQDNSIPGATIVPSRMLLVGHPAVYVGPHYPAIANRSPRALGPDEPVMVYVDVPVRPFIRGPVHAFLSWVCGG